MLKIRPLYFLATLALSVSTFVAPGAQAQSSAAYVTIDPAQVSSVPGKIEVLDFFAYTCPHCANMAPMIENWAKKLPEDVVFNRVPVAFNAGAADLQKLYFSLEAMDRLDLHPKVFDAIHKERKRIYDFKSIAKWVESQGVDRKEFESVFESFSVTHKVNQANALTKNYRIQGTPSLAIGGLYVTSPGMTGSYAGAVNEAQRRLNAVLAKAE